jgi:GT2 family glycosyltransferase
VNQALPSVSVVIPNWNGARHLRPCLDSLAQLDFPRERLEVVVVDNGSTDDSVRLLRDEYPWVKRVELDENVGFAEGSNRGAAASTGECLAFLNNDMRVDPHWLTNLLARYDPESRYVCVASVILNWEGDLIDFVDGWINFHGAADQEYRRVPLDEALIEDGRDLAFACGGAMLVEREVFQSLGGFDPRYFAFLEDVDLGWRLWLAGYKVRLAGQARSFHRGHATGSGVPPHQLFLLWERNTLLTLVKNVSDENLPGVLAAASLLIANRAGLRSESDRSAFGIGSADRAKDEVVSRTALAGLHAVGDLLEGLEDILEERQRIQQLRQRDDEEIFELFRRPFAPASRRPVYLEASLKLRAALGLDKLYSRQRITNVLVIAPDESPRLRSLAQNASSFASVIFASAKPPKRIPGVSISVIGDEKHLAELLAQSDCVVVDGPADAARFVAQESRGVVAVDLAAAKGSISGELLRRGDMFFCRSEHERDAVMETLRVKGEGSHNGDLAERVVVLPDDQDAQKAVLRTVMWEPWRWHSAAKVEMPEDFQLLVQKWREHYRRTPLPIRTVRAVWRLLPTAVQRAIYRVVPVAWAEADRP